MSWVTDPALTVAELVLMIVIVVTAPVGILSRLATFFASNASAQAVAPVSATRAVADASRFRRLTVSMGNPLLAVSAGYEQRVDTTFYEVPEFDANLNEDLQDSLTGFIRPTLAVWRHSL